MITFAIWAFVAVAGICAWLLVHLIRRGEELALIVEAQLQGLGETHMVGFESVNHQLAQLERRIKKVEDALP